MPRRLSILVHVQVESGQIAKNDGSALLKVELQLIAADACFEPPLSVGQAPSVKSFFQSWVSSYLECSQIVGRVDGQTGTQNTTCCSPQSDPASPA